MRVRVVVSYVPRYRRGHRWNFVPPVTGMHLAALVPPGHEVTLVHEQVRPVTVDDDVDLVLLSFFSGFARRAYEVADAYRARGVRVIAGGPHASYWPEEALEHVDAVVVGEAEGVLARVIADAERGTLQPIYRGSPSPLVGLPTPRYDLLEDSFVVPRVVQATRGCPFTCTFCTVPDLNPGFRMRPVGEVVRDIAASTFPHAWQDKIVWFWDDNLLAPRRWAKSLLRELTPMNRWWLTQASIDIVKDDELLALLQASGCIGIFLGIESTDDVDLSRAGKRQNRAAQYAAAIQKLHDRGICVMAGFISGFDDQTPERIVGTAERLQNIGIDVPFLSVLTPFRGTAIYDELLAAGRILRDRDWPHYNGYNVAFQPARMSPAALLAAHRELWRRAFAPAAVAARIARAARTLSPGGALLSAAMNGFYGLKRAGGNLPADALLTTAGAGTRIAHPGRAETPRRLHLAVA